MAPARAGGLGRGRGRGGGGIRAGKAQDGGNRQGNNTSGPASPPRPNAQASNRAQSRPPRGTYQPPRARKNAAGGGNNPNGTKTPPRGGGGSVGTAPLQQRYEVLKKRREEERKRAIADGFLADPDNPRTLAEAITPVGTCQDMCAEFERVERIIQSDVWKQELDPSSSTNGSSKRPDENRMVKKFRRAAAGIDEQLPSDLRPPTVLRRTVDYLFNELLRDIDSLHESHHFIWDRTRAIRNDFSIQQLRKPSDLRIAVECYERIARFHILCLHQFALPENRYDSYDQYQEREQLDRTLLSLMQYYDDGRGRIRCPNEAEFRAYCIIFQIQDPIPDLEDRVQTWPKEIVQDARVQTALQVYAAASNTRDTQGPLRPRASHPVAQENWAKFWQLVGSQKLSYLMCCVAELYFGLVRRTALHSLWQSYRRGGSNRAEEWFLADLVDVFGFDDEDQVNEFCEAFGFSVLESTNGKFYVDLSSVSGKALPEPSSNINKQVWSSRLVEAKRHNRTLSSVLNGMSVPAAREAGMIIESEQDGSDSREQSNDSLFVTGHSDEEDGVETHERAKGKPLEDKTTSKLNPFAANFAPIKPAAPPTTNQTPPSLSQPQQPDPSNPFPNAVTTLGATQPPSTTSPTRFGNALPSTNPFVSGQQPPSTSQQTTAGNSSPTAFGLFNDPLNNANKTSPFGSETKLVPNPLSPTTSIPNNSNTSTFATKSPTSPFQQTPFQKTPLSSPFKFGQTIPSTSNAFTPAQKNSNASTFPTNPPNPSLTTQPFLFGATTKLETQAPTPSSPFNLQASSQLKTPTFPPSSDILTNPFTFPTFGSPKTSPPVTTSHIPTSTPPNPAASNQFSTTLPPPTTTRPDGQRLVSEGPVQDVSLLDRKTSPATDSFKNTFQSTTLMPAPSLTSPSAQALPIQRPPPTLRDDTSEQNWIMQSLSQNLVLEPYGFLEQFVEYIVGPIIEDSLQQYEKETMQQEADDFRQHVLAHRWSGRWREICWNRRLKRQGRERRQRLARDMQAKGRSSRGSSIESQLQGFLSSSNPGSRRSPPRKERRGDEALQSPDRSSLPPTPRVGQSSSHEARLHQSTASNGRQPAGMHHGSLTAHTASPGPSYRVTKPSSSVLSGKSSFLGSSFLAGDSLLRQSVLASAGQVDTTRSSYFKLKAIGLEPGGAISKETSRKRGRDDEEGSEHGALKRADLSPPEKKPYSATANLVNGVSSTENKPPQRSANEEDEALFAQMRAARQAMSESISFFQEEIAKDTGSRKSSSEGGTTEPQGQGKSPRSVPAYWNRESKFVPRENYGKGGVKTRAKEREKKEDGVMNPPQHMPGPWEPFQQRPPAGFIGSLIASPPTPPAQEQAKGGTSAEDAIEL